jgi:hypothetical protein
METSSQPVTPSRSPVSISFLRTHSFRVCGTQPILGAIDSMAAQRDGYSPRCSCTMRTARSRTSGEKRFDFLLMTPSSQSVEPPQIPGRFKRRCVSMSLGEPCAFARRQLPQIDPPPLPVSQAPISKAPPAYPDIHFGSHPINMGRPINGAGFLNSHLCGRPWRWTFFTSSFAKRRAAVGRSGHRICRPE